jgi:Glycosyl hydrolase family 10
MGVMRFLLPAGLPPEGFQELERASVLGGHDSAPFPTHALPEPGQLNLVRERDESGVVTTPWHVPGAGRLMIGTTTLMEREQPYQLLLELARGKVNQVRCQAADWEMSGLDVPAALAGQIRDASLCFGRAASHAPDADAEDEAALALAQAFRAGDSLVEAYVNQVFQVRHQRQPRLETALGCGLAAPVEGPQADALTETFNTAYLPFPWPRIEPSEGEARWEEQDTLVDWAEGRGLSLVGGPLVDFSLAGLPGWLWLWERDRSSVASFICEHVHATVTRYQQRIRTWVVSAAVNLAAALSWSADELLWLTGQMVETVRRIDPSLEVVVSVAQPWGEYMAAQDGMHSAFVYADSMLRHDIRLNALELELVMGVTPRGSYCRDLLDTSRLLDLYSILGVPLQLTVGYPGREGEDALADAELRSGAGYWRAGPGPQAQADWAEVFVSLALAKPYVRGVHWAHFSDAVPHRFPHCGLVDADGNLRPALQRLRQLREKHLR